MCNYDKENKDLERLFGDCKTIDELQEFLDRIVVLGQKRSAQLVAIENGKAYHDGNETRN